MLKAVLVLIVVAVALVAPAMANDAAKREALLSAYPRLFEFDRNEVVFPDDERIVWDDGKVRSAEELIAAPDVEDMFHYVYPLAAAGELVPEKDFDPGRIRNEAFFKALYGDSAEAVGEHIVAVPWLGGKAQMTSLLGVDQRLAEVAGTMDGELADFGRIPGGGFSWRVIAGTNQLSVHSFGAAFDINVDYSDYWRWVDPEADVIPFKNRIPLAIVELFEAQGFIWGGRWYHYDTMHFEYRPELIAYAKAMALVKG